MLCLVRAAFIWTGRRASGEVGTALLCALCVLEAIALAHTSRGLQLFPLLVGRLHPWLY